LASVPWYVPALLIPAVVMSTFFGLKAFREFEKGTGVFTVLFLGLWAPDKNFTPAGRRYRALALGISSAAVLLVLVMYLFTSSK
jgi:hypothetical protein